MPTIDIVVGDLCQEPVDVIVNPCNSQGGGGECSRAISSRWPGATQGLRFAAGSRGDLRPIPSGMLPSSFLLNVDISDEKEHIEQMLDTALPLLKQRGLKSVSFPIVGAGAAGKDYATCARNLLVILCDFVFGRRSDQTEFLNLIRIVVFDRSKLDLVQRQYADAGGLSKMITQSRGAGVGVALVVVAISSTEGRAAVQQVPAHLRNQIERVEVRDSANAAAAATLRRMGGASASPANVGLVNDIVLLNRDKDNEVESRVFIKRKK